MKTMLPNCLLMGMIVIILSSSCTAAYQVAPTPTDTPAPTPTSTPPPPYTMLSPEDMRSDLDELFRQIEKHHPDPYMHRSKADVDRDRQALYQELGQPMTIVDFYRKVAALVASLGDNHTEVIPNGYTMAQIDGYEKGLPLGVEIENGQAFITANYSGNPDIPLGAELLAINGTHLSTIKQNLITHPGIYFAWKLWLLEGSNPEYQVAILAPGEKTPVNLTIPGMTFKEIEKRMLSDKPREEVTYRTLPEEKIGILTLNGFRSIYEPVKQAFRQIQEDGVQDLIIDIRGNGGGNMESLDLFMNYLTDQPYQKCYKCAFIQPWENVENRYQGHIYLLIGPDSMSAAVLLADILQDHQLATLVGEETAQTSSLCGYVISGGEPLPRTGLRYMTSGMCFVRPNGIVDGRGVIPDMIVETTIDDMITGSDPVLDYTLDLIRNGGQMP